MRQLFWKEWYELRLLPLASVVCVAVLMGVAKAYSHAYGNTQPFQLGDAIPTLLLTWGLFSLVTGSGLFAQEIGSGSLVFLGAMPISRHRIWWVKSSVALAVLLLSMLTSAITWILLASALLPAHALQPLWTARAGFINTTFIPLVFLDIFAASLAISPFLDRPISVTLAAALAAAVCYGFLGYFANSYMMQHFQAYTEHLSANHHHVLPARHDLTALFTVVAALPLPVFAAVSYWTFTRGETLRSAKRFRVGAISGAVSIGLAFGVFWTGSWLQWW